METILLVDDEADVVATAREMLEEVGYQILDALNAEDAVRVAIGFAGPIHLLLSDLVMPGTSGQDLAQQLAIQRPEMKVLSLHQQASHGEDPGGARDQARVTFRPAGRSLAERLRRRAPQRGLKGEYSTNRQPSGPRPSISTISSTSTATARSAPLSGASASGSQRMRARPVN